MLYFLVAISLYSLFLYFNGLIIVQRLSPKFTINSQHIAASMSAGILFIFLINIFTKSFQLTFLIGAVIAIVSIYKNRTIIKLSNYFKTNKIGLLIFLVIYVFYYIMCAYTPLSDWDARSSWFFISKVLWNQGGFFIDPMWRAEEYELVQFSYPKLFPVLTGQWMSLFNFWNEHLPKLSLLPLISIGFLHITQYYKKSFSIIILLSLVIFTFNKYLFNGYMDALLGLYFCAATLILHDYIKTENKEALLNLILLLSLAIQIKIESRIGGLLFLLFSLLLIYLHNKELLKKTFSKSIVICFFVFSIIPVVAWELLKKVNGLIDWYKPGDGLAERLSERISQFETHELIFNTLWSSALLGRMFVLLFIVLILALLNVFNNKNQVKLYYKTIAVVSGFSITYFLFLYFVFLTTPFDFKYHLTTTYDRVSFTALGPIFALIFIILNSEESPSIIETKNPNN